METSRTVGDMPGATMSHMAVNVQARAAAGGPLNGGPPVAITMGGADFGLIPKFVGTFYSLEHTVSSKEITAPAERES